MIKGLTRSIFMGLSVLACSDNDNITKNCGDGRCTYSVYEDSELVMLQNEAGLFANIEEGSDLVFEYRFDYADDQEIADDELTVLLRWEVPSNVDEFELSTDAFIANKAVYRRLCYCIRDDYEYVNAGSIIGTRKNHRSWDVIVDIEIAYYDNQPPQLLSFQRTFEVK